MATKSTGTIINPQLNYNNLLVKDWKGKYFNLKQYIMTPQEYLKEEFKEEPMLWDGSVENSKLMSIRSCKELMELYHNFEINRILNETKSK